MAADRRKTKHPGIFKRGGRYSFTYRDNLGRQRWGSAATLAAARAAKSAASTDVVRGEYRALSRATFADYAPRWIASYKGRTSKGVGPETIADYRRALGLDEAGSPLEPARGAIAFFGRIMLAEIGAPELRAYADHVAARGLARDTVRLALAPVKALLATAHEDGLIRSNPAAGLRNLLPADRTRGGARQGAFTGGAAALLATVPDAWRLFFEFLAETGLRIGEAVEVRWRDIDGQRLAVERRWYRGRVGLPKGRKTRRVPLSPRMSRALWTLRKETRGGGDDLVFTAEKRGRLDQSNLTSRVLKPAATAAGAPWASYHTFRHTCATMLFRSGWNAGQVQRFLGHADPGFTLRRYVHLLDSDLHEPSVLDGLPAARAHVTAAIEATPASVRAARD